jgi:hypothetical protein
MDKNLNIVAKELFGKIRTQFPKIKLGDADSVVTNKPEDARFFDFDFTHDGEVLGRISISISEDDGLVVLYSNDVIADQTEYVKDQFFNFLKELREFAKQKLLNFDTRDIAKSNLEKRDYEYMSNNNGEGTMSESKLFGTSKTSYQQMENAKIIVKHSAPVNYDNPAGRTQRIESIYIENAQGERFRYPFKHLNGARALAQHVAHGGTPYDTIGEHVIGLSEELSKLRMFKQYVDRNNGLSEAMGNIHSRVMERIDQVKKEIHQLQSPTRYTEFAEAFTATEAKEIPEEIMNDWIDRLTIRTFNEELKNVFPYIFKLVDEGDIPVKALTADDLLGEESQTENDINLGDIAEVAQFEDEINRMVGEGTDIFSQDEQAQMAAIDQLNALLAQPFPVGTDGNNAIESLSNIIDDDELMDIFKELADVSPEADVKDILKDYVTMKDEENGTDVLSKLNFEAPVEPEPVPAEPAAAPAPAAAPVEQPVPMAEEKDKGEFSKDSGWVKSNNKNPVGKVHNLAGQALKKAIAKAKKAGATAESIIQIGEQELTLANIIEQAGMSVEDIFGNKRQQEQKELIEFVSSMFDQTTGGFPKGETGVLIAVEKKFGESAVGVAKHVMGKLQTVRESQRIMQLAGLAK